MIFYQGEKLGNMGNHVLSVEIEPYALGSPPPRRMQSSLFLNLHFVTGWGLHKSNMHNQLKAHQEKCSDDVCFFSSFEMILK